MLRRASASFAAQLWSLALSLANRFVLVGIRCREYPIPSILGTEILLLNPHYILVGVSTLAPTP